MSGRDETAPTQAAESEGAGAESTPPAAIGRFVVTGSLGSGGMGIVLSAVDPKLDRRVAIKLLHPGAWHGSDGRDRLQREAQAMAKVAHPNVVHVYEVGETADGQLFIVMELVEGETLKQWLQRERRTVDEIMRVFIGAARGLEAAHRAGLIHRDVKPSNILVGKDGRARIGDFGLVSPMPATTGATAADGSTQTSGVVGTVGYMSPEHFGPDADARADQFSFCVALFEALHGRRPFFDGSLVEYQETLRQDVPRVARPTGVSARAHDAVMRGLRIDPSLRWPSMSELLDAIEPAPPPTTRVPGAIAFAIASIVLVIAGFVAYRTRHGGGAPALRGTALPQRQVTFVGNVFAMALSPDGQTLAYTTKSQLVLQDIDKGKQRTLDIGGQIQYIHWTPDSRELHLNVFSGNEGTRSWWRIPREGEPQHAEREFLFGRESPTGELARLAPSRRAIDIERDGKVVRTLPIAGSYIELWVEDWSPDGQHLLISTMSQSEQRRTIWTVTPDGSHQAEIATEVGPIVSRPGMGATFVQQDRAVMYLRPVRGDYRQLVYVPLHNGQRAGEPRVIVDAWPSSWFSISRDDKRVAIEKTSGTPEIWVGDVDHPDAAERSVRWRRLIDDAAVKRSPRLSPDGRLVAYVSRDDETAMVYVVPVAGGVPKRVGPRGARRLDLAWSPDSRQLALIDDAEHALYVVSLADGAVRRFDVPELGEMVNDGLFWAPSRYIAYRLGIGHNYALLDPTTGKQHRLLPQDSEGLLFNLIWSPDGTHVATYWHAPTATRQSPILKVLDLDGGERSLARGWLPPIGWSSDGRWIYVKEMANRELLRIPAAGGKLESWIPLNAERLLYDCRVAADATHVACASTDKSDIWIIDDFDRVLPRR